jgi:bisphosphoglycerate-independent phosphoglycerate mutase (AlkP superfamily)
VLTILERFISALLRTIDFSSCALIIASDHGNLEDPSTPHHTQNPVPYFVRGPGREILIREVRDLSDITPRILEWFSAE